MSKIKLNNGIVYDILDYATPNTFDILLAGMTIADMLKVMTEENLSAIQFLTDSGAVTGTYHNKLLCGYIDNGSTLTVSINDADLCRYGLALGDDSRIIGATVQRYAPAGAVIVDELPEGNVYDYRYENGEFIYDPLPGPGPEIPEEPVSVWDELDAAYQRGVDSV